VGGRPSSGLQGRGKDGALTYLWDAWAVCRDVVLVEGFTRGKVAISHSVVA
jgi:hypothetical protein